MTREPGRAPPRHAHTPVLLPGKSHGWRSPVGYSAWGRKESDTTEWLYFTSKFSICSKICLKFPKFAHLCITFYWLLKNLIIRFIKCCLEKNNIVYCDDNKIYQKYRRWTKFLSTSEVIQDAIYNWLLLIFIDQPYFWAPVVLLICIPQYIHLSHSLCHMFFSS